jgi:hypothetical protein
MQKSIFIARPRLAPNVGTITYLRGGSMQQYLRNASSRRFACGKIVMFKLGLVALVVIGTMAFTQVANAALTLRFDQSAYHGDVWIQVQDPNYGTANSFQAKYDNGAKSIDFTDNGKQVLMSVPVKLSDIGAGGLVVQFASSVGIYVFYDDPSQNDRTIPPEPLNPVIPSYHQRWQEFELTMTGGASDQGDVTAIDCFTAPLGITSYDVNGTRLQSVGWSANAFKVGADLKRFATISYPPTPTAVAVAKDAEGRIYRYIGPSKFNPANPSYKPMPWPSFIPYTKSIYAAGKQTHIYNQNSFNGKNGYTYAFGADMQLTAKSDGSLSITSKITATSTPTTDPNLPSKGYWDDSGVSGGNPWTISAGRSGFL